MEESLTELKKRNKQLVKEDMRARRCITRGYPYMVSLATDMRCNLNCIMCFRHVYAPHQIENAHTLDENLFIKFADEVFPTAEVLQLNTIGEPLLSRNIDLELEYAAKYDVKLEVATNGMLFDSHYRNIEILLRQAKTISFSFDSPFRETCESIRLGSNYARVIENMNFFQAYRNTLPPDEKPGFSIIMVLMKRNLNEILPMIEFAKKIGADQLSIIHTIIYTEEMKKESVLDIKEAVNAVLTKAAAKAQEIQLPLSLPIYAIEKEERKDFIDSPQDQVPIEQIEKSKKLCFFLWERAYLDLEANIIACCSENHPIMGNIKTNSFAEIWNGEKYQQMRQTFSEGKPYALCYDCSKTGYLSHLT